MAATYVFVTVGIFFILGLVLVALIVPVVLGGYVPILKTRATEILNHLHHGGFGTPHQA